MQQQMPWRHNNDCLAHINALYMQCGAKMVESRLVWKQSFVAMNFCMKNKIK
jgi:hypothetical protein